MPESNAQAPSGAPDFNAEFHKARSSGDFEFVLDTAKKSHRMLVDFRNAVKESTYTGANATAIGMGLNFLENMIAQAAAQLATLKQTEKETLAAIKSAQEHPGTPIGVVDPDKPGLTH